MAYTDPSNRGRRAYPYVEGYGREFYGAYGEIADKDERDQFLTVASDLLADMFHLAAQYGVTPDELVGTAEYHFSYESTEIAA